jgi:alkanesulfonate monooxygenase SsuD/methylene tetrahydromethanopterin reductase-like flavin-dependent oxidoreductase (luciferase family)
MKRSTKRIVTADHIARGRFGLNIVCAWNQDEFDMFGLEQDAHDDRYARGKEWLEILLRLWSEEAPFDDDGRSYQLKGVVGRSLPRGGRRPILMNAGTAVAGRAFGACYCDPVFDQPHSPRAGTRSHPGGAAHGTRVRQGGPGLHLRRSGVPSDAAGGRRVLPLFRG